MLELENLLGLKTVELDLLAHLLVQIGNVGFKLIFISAQFQLVSELSIVLNHFFISLFLLANAFLQDADFVLLGKKELLKLGDFFILLCHCLGDGV